MEAVIIIDVLRRAGVDVTVASVEDGRLQVECARRTRLVADAGLADALAAGAQYDAVLLPGGMPGAERLRDSDTLREAVCAQNERGALVGAICAAPQVALASWGVITEDTKATAHPAFSDKLPDPSAQASRVVREPGLLTSRGPGTAFEFALAAVEELCGADVADEIAGPMVLHEGYESWR
eukprot:PRCOL_00002036-RA